MDYKYNISLCSRFLILINPKDKSKFLCFHGKIKSMTIATAVSCSDGHCVKTFGPYGVCLTTTFSDEDMMFNNITEITVTHGSHING